MTESLRFSTAPFAPEERPARLIDFYSWGADAVELGGPVSAEVQGWRIDNLAVVERHIVGIGTERLAPRVQHNQFDHFTLQFVRAGEYHGEGDSGFQIVLPGEIMLFDMTKLMRSRMPDVQLITVSLPRAIVEAAAGSTGEMHGLIIPAACAAPVTEFLIASIEQVKAGQAADLPLSDLLTQKLRAALKRMGLAKQTVQEQTDIARLLAARLFIRAHLSDETLDPQKVAKATNLSRATLYRVFEATGGVRKYVQTLRLALLRSRLSDPTDVQPVSALAFDAGFASENHANRSFRMAFGLPPAAFRREIRRFAQSRYGEQATVAKVQFSSWIADLDVPRDTSND